jgi:hypothetical protein
MPLALGVWNPGVAGLGSPRRKGGREIIAHPLAVPALREVTIENGALGVIQGVVSFSEYLRLSLATVHDVGDSVGRMMV